MHSLRDCFFTALLVLGFGGLGTLAGCGQAAGSGSLPPHVSDICPDNPAQCGGACCGSQCIDVTSDPNNCGGCDVVCPSGGACVNGSCAGCGPSGNACDTGQMCCGSNGCKSLDSDVNNCGACGTVCPSGVTCVSGQCTTGGTSTPDMGGSSGGACDDCTTSCLLGCAGNDCCLENALGLVTPMCDPDPDCLQ